MDGPVVAHRVGEAQHAGTVPLAAIEINHRADPDGADADPPVAWLDG